MKLPKWFPGVSRPFNPAYAEVWDQMTPEERQQSMAIDLGVVVITGAILLVLAGCQRAPDAPPGPGEVVSDGSTDPEDLAQRETGLPIVVDPTTGCQYIGYTGHGVTPRLDEQGKPICLQMVSPIDEPVAP